MIMHNRHFAAEMTSEKHIRDAYRLDVSKHVDERLPKARQREVLPNFQWPRLFAKRTCIESDRLPVLWCCTRGGKPVKRPKTRRKQASTGISPVLAFGKHLRFGTPSALLSPLAAARSPDNRKVAAAPFAHGNARALRGGAPYRSSMGT